MFRLQSIRAVSGDTGESLGGELGGVGFARNFRTFSSEILVF